MYLLPLPTSLLSNCITFLADKLVGHPVGYLQALAGTCRHLNKGTKEDGVTIYYKSLY